MYSDTADMLTWLVSGLIIGFFSGLMFVVEFQTLTFDDPTYKIESVNVSGKDCNYGFLSFKFKADCGKFNVGDIVSFERVK